MKVSVVTVAYNAASTIENTIQSVLSQDYSDVEYIVIDGASTDNTITIVNEFRHSINIIVSEPDKGIYDAMNKGIKLATGDIIGFLNADDVYADNTILSQIADAHKDQTIDACYADLVYVKKNDLNHVVRKWVSEPHYSGLCFNGWMPAHPTLYIKARVFEDAGGFDTALKIQSDLEFCTRVFEKHQIKSRYIPKLWVRMRLGGASNNSVKNIMRGNWESYIALKKLGLPYGFLNYFWRKFSYRIKQFF